MRTKVLISFLLAVTLGAVLFTGWFVWQRLYFKGRILKGYHIGNVHVGGMTPEEAFQAISTMEADELAVSSLFLEYDDGKKITKYEFTPSQAGAMVMAKETVDDAVAMSQNETILQPILFGLKKKKVVISPRFRIIDKGELSELLSKVSYYINQKPLDARFVTVSSAEKGKRKYATVIQPDREGRVLMSEKTAVALQDDLASGRTRSRLFVKVTMPKVTTEMLKKIPDPEVIGSYTTYYGTHDSPNRIHNIYLVASFVDNTYIASGEVFSLLKPIGEFTKERGFKEAYVIMGDELVPELGGGTCQIATTLYNAVMMADLDVMSRRNHGMYFSIYPLGRDATVYPPYTDFKFRNNTGHPIVVQAHPFRRGLTFRIYGSPTGKSVSFTYPRLSFRSSRVTTVEPETGETVERTVQGPAFAADVVRTVMKDGRIVEREKIHSFYKLHGDKQKVKIRRKEPR